ncbi:hypothetical protein BH09GEM1_BH09GEM1_08260 [soil metagenome]
MTLLVSSIELVDRRAIALGSLAPLARGLLNELTPLIDHPVDVPREKALLSRRGGRCDIDGAYLTFDPFDAHHRCAVCGREYTGVGHDRFRLYWYQLWLAERTLHAALLGVLIDDAPARGLAVHLLEQYAEQYLQYPNADNVLGPSRPFFSTYLESIWLLQLTTALSLLESGAPSVETSALGAMVRERLIHPSATLIASYDEGMSNRQVWNNAALMAAARMLDNRIMFEHAIHGPSGLHAHLTQGLLGDGTWYEGENYHLFAHRGLWYGERLSTIGGEPLPPHLQLRYREAFAAPFRSVLPDLTYPSRRDSQYAVSIRQARFAESCELGLAYGDDARLTGTLALLYDPSVPRGETGRRASSADVERNLPATGLQRADLSWRTLLCARAELPPLVHVPLRSDLLPAQGLGIIRREGGALYASLDYGHSGGGHGHPDRLNFTLVHGTRRWFDDPGTGSYVDASLHWYRSTLAHNAPVIDGRSQPRVHGTLEAFEDDGDAGLIAARATLAPGLIVRRTLLVLDDYLIDELRWESDDTHDIILPMHGVEPDAVRTTEPEAALGEAGVEDGFDFLEDVTRVVRPDPGCIRLHAQQPDGAPLDGWSFPSTTATVWSTTAPAPPNAVGRRPLVLIRDSSAFGSILSVWSWNGAVVSARREDGALVVERIDGRTHRHSVTDSTWTIDGLRSGPVVLRRERGSPASESPIPSSAQPAPSEPALSHVIPVHFHLAEASYRRSEPDWLDAGQPQATVSVSRMDRRNILVEIDILESRRRFTPIDTPNELDNEPASINGDSVQLYALSSGRGAGLLLVPSASGVDTRPIDGWSNDLIVKSMWESTARGYRLMATLELDVAATELRLDVIINETTSDRERRRGQLVLSGAAGEFVYLRGDRHDPSRLLRLILPQ